MSISALRHRSLGLGLAAALVLTGGLTACSSDDDSSSTTTAKSDSSTTTVKKTTTTTTALDSLPTVSDVWAPPTAAGENVTVSLSITGGAEDDSLVSVSVASDWAESAALVPDASVEIPATSTVDLDADGAHIELTGLKKALEDNKPFEVTLKFETAPEQTVQGVVRSESLGAS